MKDYTHELSGVIGGKMSRTQNYSEEKEAVVTYGIELILNSQDSYLYSDRNTSGKDAGSRNCDCRIRCR